MSRPLLLGLDQVHVVDLTLCICKAPRPRPANSAAATTSTRYSAYNYQVGGGPPTEPVYTTGSNVDGGTGWVDVDASPSCISGCGIAVAVGGR